MRLENTYRFWPRALFTVVLSTALANCSSELPDETMTPGNTAGTGAGTAAGTSSGGASGSGSGTSGSATSAGTASGGVPASGGTTGTGTAGVATGGGGTGSGVGGTATAGASGTGTVGGSGGSGGGAAGNCAVPADLSTWPTGKGPTEIGKAAVENFKSHTGDAYGGAGYAWTFTYVASLQFTKLIGDTASNMKLIMDFERYASGSTGAPTNAANASVDDRAFGDLPLEIYIENQDERSKTLGLARADQQWAMMSSDGITSDARYWADDMFMITGLQVYAYRATKDVKYLTRAAKAMIAYETALQQSDGHFWHTKQSKAYWGRANGWVAAGVAELLKDLPAGADRDTIMASYKKQMDGLLAVQITSGADAGMWRQVLNLTTAKVESSCTAMFTFALITGIRNGWLTDAKYLAAAKAGWTALGNKTDSNGVLAQVCPGTGQAPAGDLASQQKFYNDITFGSNDQHGQAPLLWTAIALLRPDCPGVR